MTGIIFIMWDRQLLLWVYIVLTSRRTFLLFICRRPDDDIANYHWPAWGRAGVEVAAVAAAAVGTAVGRALRNNNILYV